MGSFSPSAPGPAGVQGPPPPPPPTLHSDNLASRVAAAVPMVDFGLWTFPFTGTKSMEHPQRLRPRKEGIRACLSAELCSPFPYSTRKPGQGPEGRGLAPSAASQPLRFTSRTFPKAQRAGGEIWRSNHVLLSRPVPSSALPAPAAQTLFSFPSDPAASPRRCWPLAGAPGALPAVPAREPFLKKPEKARLRISRSADPPSPKVGNHVRAGGAHKLGRENASGCSCPPPSP